MPQFITIDRHTGIVGTTEFGKSYFTKKTLKAQTRGVLYFNSICDNVDTQGYTLVDGKCRFEDIVRALEKGKKLNYNPSTIKGIMESELLVLLRHFMSIKSTEFIFAIEEMHLLDDNKELVKMFEQVAFAGRHHGIRAVWITQRPQSFPRGCITQTTQMIFFNLNFEDSWLSNYGLKADMLKNEIQGRKYYYCRWTPGGGLEKAAKL